MSKIALLHKVHLIKESTHPLRLLPTGLLAQGLPPSFPHFSCASEGHRPSHSHDTCVCVCASHAALNLLTLPLHTACSFYKSKGFMYCLIAASPPSRYAGADFYIFLLCHPAMPPFGACGPRTMGKRKAGLITSGYLVEQGKTE